MKSVSTKYPANMLALLTFGIGLLLAPAAIRLVPQLARPAANTNAAGEQTPPAPSSFHEEAVGPRLVRVDDYERGVTCYRYSYRGGVWCYESGVTP